MRLTNPLQLKTDPEEIKETMADFYENLYTKRPTRPHPHHEPVKKDMNKYQNDMSHNNEWYNHLPTVEEVKKNGKATRT